MGTHKKKPLPHSTITTVRSFNRFYTSHIGILNDVILESDLALVEGRVLYELHEHGILTARELMSTLGTDEGYLSRILKKLYQRGLIQRTIASNDRRKVHIKLSEKGRSAAILLNHRADKQIVALIEKLGARKQKKLTEAMKTIEELLQ